MSVTSTLVLPPVSTIPADSTSSEIASELGKLIRRVITNQALKASESRVDCAAKFADILPIGTEALPMQWDMLTRTAKCALNKGRLVDAERMLLNALDSINGKANGDSHLVEALDNLANFYLNQRKFAEAAHYGNRACDAAARIDGPNTLTLATCLNTLAGALYEMGRFDEAEQICIRVLTIYNKVLGGEHPNCGVAANNLAMVYQVQGKLSLSELMYERALPIRVKELGPAHPHVKALLTNYMNLLASSNKLADLQFAANLPKATAPYCVAEKTKGLRVISNTEAAPHSVAS